MSLSSCKDGGLLSRSVRPTAAKSCNEETDVGPGARGGSGGAVTRLFEETLALLIDSDPTEGGSETLVASGTRILPCCGVRIELAGDGEYVLDDLEYCEANDAAVESLQPRGLVRLGFDMKRLRES
jgi:hypothetical protein